MLLHLLTGPEIETILNALFMNLVIYLCTVGLLHVFLLLFHWGARESSNTIQTQSGQGDFEVSILKSSLCFTVKMISQPVWSVHVLLIQQHGCWPRDIREEGVLWRSSHLFFPGEGRGCSSARNTSRAEGIPGITPSVLWFPPFHPPLWGCQDHLPSSPDLHWDLYLIPVWGFPGSLLCEHSSQWCWGGCKTEDNQMNPGRRGRFAALVGCNCNNLTVTQEGSTETSRQAEDVSNNRFYRWPKTHTWVWMALFSQPLSCSSVTPQFSFCQNPQVFKASADRENMEEKTVLFHRGVRILWKPSGRLMLAPSL